jgi:hypothetical protein
MTIYLPLFLAALAALAMLGLAYHITTERNANLETLNDDLFAQLQDAHNALDGYEAYITYMQACKTHSRASEAGRMLLGNVDVGEAMVVTRGGMLP